MKFAFIEAEKAHFPVAALCALLSVMRAGFYAFHKRDKGARVKRDEQLREQVKEAYDRSGNRYGSPRVLRDLERQGVHTSKRRVERAMRQMGLRGRAPR